MEIEPLRLRIRALLIDVRKTQAVSQRMLAKRLGRPQSYVWKYECGERKLDVCEWLEVLEALSADPVAFLSKLSSDIDSTTATQVPAMNPK